MKWPIVGWVRRACFSRVPSTLLPPLSPRPSLKRQGGGAERERGGGGEQESNGSRVEMSGYTRVKRNLDFELLLCAEGQQTEVTVVRR